MPAQSNIQTIVHAGHACLQLSTRHGTAIVALHGAHLLSWVPKGQSEVFWVSPISPPAPAAIRGGVPICWPWFGKQGMPPGAMQHGPMRNLQWALDAVHADGLDQVSITLSPCRNHLNDEALRQFAPHLRVAMHITLDDCLVQTLETHNHGTQTFGLTQALHSYFAVKDATQVQVHGLMDLRFEDKLLDAKGGLQQGCFQLDTACDRIYLQNTPSPKHQYTLDDALAQRRIHLQTDGSQSVVLWNPGAEQARKMADIPDAAWHNFLCVETSNAGQDVVLLAPGGQHRLTQILAVERSAAAPLQPIPAP